MSIGTVGKRMLVWAALSGALLVIGASAESKARIVRLSNVEGSVQMDRGGGDGFEKAFLNLPVIQGSKLRTRDDGRAEVEFEDGSVLHLANNSELDFSRLALGDDGQKLSVVELAEGTVYVNARSKKGDSLTLNFGRESVAVTEAMHFRVDLTKSDATLAVFQGNVQVEGPSGKVEVAKKHSATFDLANNDGYALAKSYEESPDDGWDQKQNEYHDRYAQNIGADVTSHYSYGMSDMNYYGSYFGVPGYGMVWQPYLAGAGWSPFQDGAWAWYPGQGYMWVSAYPWGWTPYYYGNWAFAPGYGWVWQPGSWNTWNSVPRVTNPPGRTPIPVAPVRSASTVMVGRGLSVNPPAGGPRRLTLAPGSASLGVPRGTVHHLDRYAKEMEKSSRPVVVTTEAPTLTAPTSYPNSLLSNSGTRSSSPPVRSMGAPHSSSPHSGSHH